MRCAICRTGQTQPGTADEALTHHGTTLVVKDVPAEICDQCGEAYFDSSTTAQLLDLARAAAQAGVVVDVRHYAA